MPDSQSLILLAAAVVAAVVCVRLYLVLGRRTGKEPSPQDLAERQRAQQRAGQAIAPPPAPIASGQTAPHQPTPGGLVNIQLADRSFDTGRFMAGAREAYGRIVKAFAAGDSAALAPLVSPHVLDAFHAAIAARGDSPAPAFTALDGAGIQGATLEGRHAEITLVFNAQFTGTGGPQTVKDVWTFARDLDSADPNWTLVATAGEEPV